MVTFFIGEKTNFNPATTASEFSKLKPRMNQVGGFMRISRRCHESFLLQ